MSQSLEEQSEEVERLQVSWLSWVVKTSHRMRGRCRKKENLRMPSTGGMAAGAAEDMAKTGGMAAGVPLEEKPSNQRCGGGLGPTPLRVKGRGGGLLLVRAGVRPWC